MILGCLLLYQGWFRLGWFFVIWFACMYPAYFTNEINCIVRKDEQASPFWKLACRMFAMVLFVLTGCCATSYSNYDLITNPQTSVRGISVRDLASHVAKHPDSYDVILTDGYVDLDSEGVAEFHTARAALAPIYISRDLVGGVPVAWVISNGLDAILAGYKITPTYCGSTGGLCGLYAGLLPALPKHQGTIEGADVTTSAMRISARKGGFSVPAPLPSLSMLDVADSIRNSKRWMRFLWLFGFAAVALVVGANADFIISSLKGSDPEDQSLLRP